MHENAEPNRVGSEVALEDIIGGTTKGEADGAIGTAQTISAEGTGQDLWTKFIFASGITSGSFFLVVTIGTKDIYLLEFGADATLLGVFWVIINFVSPFLNILIGYWMTAAPISESMGQFGFWLVFACVFGSLGAFGMWVGRPEGAVEIWFFITALMCWTAYLVAVLVYDGSRCCIYPFKEERVAVEGFTKGLFLAVVVLYAGGYLVFLASPSVSMQVVFACVSMVFGFMSMIALGMVRRAVQPGEQLRTHGLMATFQGYVKAFTYDANMWCCLTRFCTGSWEGITATIAIFYLTYVNNLSREDRSYWITRILASTTLVEAICIPIWAWYFSDVRRRESQLYFMQYLVAAFRGLDAIFMFMMFVVQSEVKPLSLLVVACLARGLFSPFTYWRISAQSWCVDEYSHKTHVRSEALFYALHAFWYELGRGFIQSIIFMGMGPAGLKTKNCIEECDALPFMDNELCLDNCQLELNAMQPESLRNYLRFNYMIVCPVCEMLCAFCIFKFPIKGQRLATLYQKQAEQFKLVEIPNPPSIVAAKYRYGSQRTMATSITSQRTVATDVVVGSSGDGAVLKDGSKDVAGGATERTDNELKEKTESLADIDKDLLKLENPAANKTGSGDKARIEPGNKLSDSDGKMEAIAKGMTKEDTEDTHEEKKEVDRDGEHEHLDSKHNLLTEDGSPTDHSVIDPILRNGDHNATPDDMRDEILEEVVNEVADEQVFNEVADENYQEMSASGKTTSRKTTARKVYVDDDEAYVT